MKQITDKIHVNAPFKMLYETYIGYFIKHRLNPEISFDAVTLESFSMSDFRKVAEQLLAHDLSITFHGPFIDLCPGSSDPGIRELTRHRFEQVLELIPLFKPKIMVCHAGYDWKRYLDKRDFWIEKSLEIWSWLGADLKDKGCGLVLENTYEHGPEDIAVLFENLRDQDVGFCLDIGHQNVFSRTSSEKWLESLGTYTRHIHLHDNLGSHDDHLGLGKGSIDFQPVFNFLKQKQKKQPTITIEPHKESDLWPSIEYLEKAWSC
ncbi:MAG: sugar phosphate isomerase/epimerase [Desulfobacterales bacterium]|nr:sugar phosphate isomerase/epimerase [Desulfobacterales bacterium]